MKRHRSRAFSAGILAMAMAVAGLLPAQEAQAVEATGGTVTTSGGYTIHTFTSNGTFAVTTGGSVEYLIVGGGGGGGGGWQGGGGGAGGYLTGSATLSAGTYDVTVGAGGKAGTGYGVVQRLSSGGNSVFNSLTAIGGGSGAQEDPNTVAPGTGGSGGGGAHNGGVTGAAGTKGQGYPGGNGLAIDEGNIGGGGGGGSSGPGTTATPGVMRPAGGPGTANSISGASVTYAAGGAGANRQLLAAGGMIHEICMYSGDQVPHRVQEGADGAANTGNGGGGGGGRYTHGHAHGSSVGGNGGSGIVIVRYLSRSVDREHRR